MALPEKFSKGAWKNKEVEEWLDTIGHRPGGIEMWPSVWVELCFLVSLQECLLYVKYLSLADVSKYYPYRHNFLLFPDKWPNAFPREREPTRRLLAQHNKVLIEFIEWFAEFSVELKVEYNKCIDEGFEPGKPLPVVVDAELFTDATDKQETKPPPAQPGPPKPSKARSRQMAKKVDISYLDEDTQKEIKEKINKAKNVGKVEEAKKAKVKIDKYYKIKAEIEEELIKKLDGTELGRKSNSNLLVETAWLPSRILKIIANLPLKRAETDDGLLTAIKRIETGKVGARKRKAVAKDSTTILVKTSEAGDTQVIPLDKKKAPAKKKKTSAKKTTTKKKSPATKAIARKK